MKLNYNLYENIEYVGGFILGVGLLSGLTVFIANKIREIPLGTTKVMFEIFSDGSLKCYYMDEIDNIFKEKKFSEKVISKKDYQKLLTLNSNQLTKEFKKLGTTIRKNNKKLDKYIVYVYLHDNPSLKIQI